MQVKIRALPQPERDIKKCAWDGCGKFADYAVQLDNPRSGGQFWINTCARHLGPFIKQHTDRYGDKNATCEWRWDYGMQMWDTGCGSWSPVPEDAEPATWEHCPYCGRPVEFIVPDADEW